jgi:hypothetical protein
MMEEVKVMRLRGCKKLKFGITRQLRIHNILLCLIGAHSAGSEGRIQEQLTRKVQWVHQHAGDIWHQFCVIKSPKEKHGM